MRILAAVLVASNLVGAVAAQGSTWYVDNTGTSPGTGTQTDPYTSIQYAISQTLTVTGDTVEVLPGTGIYLGDIDFLGKDIHLLGDPVAQGITIQGTGTGSVVSFLNGETRNAILEGFTVTGAGAGGRGGIRIENSGASVLSCVVTGNAAGTYGGGFFISLSNCLLRDCRIENNTAGDYGGGLYAEDSTLDVEDCVVSNNQNGMYLLRVAATIQGSSFLSNSWRGVSIDDLSSMVPATISNSTFDGNGGAIQINGGGRIEIIGNTIQNNHTNYGGGIFFGQRGPRSALVQDNVFVANTASEQGGGLHIGLWSGFTGSVIDVLDNSISLGVAGESGGGLFLRGGSSIQLTLADNVISNNSASANWGTGGGAYLDCWGATAVVIERCIFQGNQTNGSGGALRLVGGTPSLRNNLIGGLNPGEGNSAEGQGGGISVTTGIDSVCDAIVGNDATGAGANIWLGDTTVPSSFLNSVIFGSGANSFVQTYANPNLITATYSLLEGEAGESWFGQGCLDEDPLLASTVNGHVVPTAYSPLIHAGDPNWIGAPGELDLSGNPRIVGGVVDMGSEENQEFHLRLEVDQLVTQSAGEFRIYECAAGGKTITAWSMVGPGTTSIPFGTLYLDAGFQQSQPIYADANGVVVGSTGYLPLTLIGRWVWLQSAEILGGGTGKLSNPQARMLY